MPLNAQLELKTSMILYSTVNRFCRSGSGRVGILHQRQLFFSSMMDIFGGASFYQL